MERYQRIIFTQTGPPSNHQMSNLQSPPKPRGRLCLGLLTGHEVRGSRLGLRPRSGWLLAPVRQRSGSHFSVL